MKRLFKALFALACLGGLALFATACNNTQTYASQCAYQIQNGYFDARHVKDILHPGERKNSNNVTTRYVYCNARNFVWSTKPSSVADVHSPIEARTNKNQYGDGTPVNVELGLHFSLNENENVMLRFLGFCEKYSCFSSKDTSGNSNLANSSSAGWMNMLHENMRFAGERATREAMLKFAPDIWNDQSQWPKVADEIQKNIKSELKAQEGVPEDFFCGAGVAPEGGAYSCPDISVTVDNIEPQDEQVRRIYNQQVQQQQLRALADQQKKTNEAELEAAKAKYGSHAEFFLGLQDVCKNAKPCVLTTAGSGVSVTGR
jgi:hypothetical protein